MSSDERWRAIDFWVADESAAQEIVEMAKRLGLAASGEAFRPDQWLTMHLDIYTAVALDALLSTSVLTPAVKPTVDRTRQLLTEWLGKEGRGPQP